MVGCWAEVNSGDGREGERAGAGRLSPLDRVRGRHTALRGGGGGGGVSGHRHAPSHASVWVWGYVDVCGCLVQLGLAGNQIGAAGASAVAAALRENRTLTTVGGWVGVFGSGSLSGVCGWWVWLCACARVGEGWGGGVRLAGGRAGWPWSWGAGAAGRGKGGLREACVWGGDASGYKGGGEAGRARGVGWRGWCWVGEGAGGSVVGEVVGWAQRVAGGRAGGVLFPRDAACFPLCVSGSWLVGWRAWWRCVCVCGLSDDV